MVQKKSTKLLIRTIKISIAIILVFFAVLTTFWILATSFNKAQSLLGASIIPKHLTLNNYVELLTSKTLNFSKWMLNSFKVTLISVK